MTSTPVWIVNGEQVTLDDVLEDERQPIALSFKPAWTSVGLAEQIRAPRASTMRTNTRESSASSIHSALDLANNADSNKVTTSAAFAQASNPLFEELLVCEEVEEGEKREPAGSIFMPLPHIHDEMDAKRRYHQHYSAPLPNSKKNSDVSTSSSVKGATLLKKLSSLNMFSKRG